MMTKIMLIDATHPEDTRVAILRDNKLDEIDFETSTKAQNRGNIYLAKVARVEPSLQACFVEYGGNRHGFLPFSEIHPDYYQIPVEDRRRILEAEAKLHEENSLDRDDRDTTEEAAFVTSESATDDLSTSDNATTPASDDALSGQNGAANEITNTAALATTDETGQQKSDNDDDDDSGDNDDVRRKLERMRRRLRSSYRIQEVVKRGQIMLVQVVKDERGNKGAAMTTYMSLAGRYCVLMPNTARGGGVSRKISSAEQRRRLRDCIKELNLPDGMGIIVRTAGSERSPADIKRDFDYLTNEWDAIREKTLASVAPCLVHEESNLIKRALRDLFSRDIQNIFIEGEQGYQAAKNFMRALMPGQLRRLKRYSDPLVPLFHKHAVESQLDQIHQHVVNLPSGGYIVINPTEALTSIDVNSGRATRDRHIDETALRTNLEAADEIARQLRLRDQGGLVVIDFIDMRTHSHNAQVERRMREALRGDRARVQVGRISHFGLLELSRQRLRPSALESYSTTCPHCQGSGIIRSDEMASLRVLRAIEEEGMKLKSAEIEVRVPTVVALYLLNRKRTALDVVEKRYRLHAEIVVDGHLLAGEFKIERKSDLNPFVAEELRQAAAAQIPPIDEEIADYPAEEEPYGEDAPSDDSGESAENTEATAAPRQYAEGEGEGRGRRRRGRGRGRNGRYRGRERDGNSDTPNDAPTPDEPASTSPEAPAEASSVAGRVISEPSLGRLTEPVVTTSVPSTTAAATVPPPAPQPMAQTNVHVVDDVDANQKSRGGWWQRLTTGLR